MLERFNQLAEQAATSVSRRQFLGRFGKGALMLAGALSATLAFPADAMVGRPCPPGTHRSRCPDGRFVCCPRGSRCVGRGCNRRPPE